MSYFYAEQVTYCECFMPRQIGWQVMNELGQIQLVHFQQKSINYQNPYSKSLKRCDQSIAKLIEVNKYIQQIKPNFKFMKVQSYKHLLKEFNKNIIQQKIHGHLYINQIQDQINNIYEYLSHQKKQSQHQTRDLTKKVLDLVMYITLLNCQDFQIISKQKGNLSNSSVFDYKCVVINQKDVISFEKGIFRISRGNSWTKLIHFNKQKLTKILNKQFKFLADKIACIIMFQFGQNNMLLNKINKYLSSMNIQSFSLSLNKCQDQILQLQSQIKQMQNLENMTNDAVERYLHKLYQPYGNSQFSFFTYLYAYALKEREIYRKLASTTQSKSFLHFCIYIPTKSLPLKLNLNQKLPPLTLTPKQPTGMPPTKLKSCQILQYPQQILNTYGIPSYNELNPAPLYIVTFSFFIGIMFGDIGHVLMVIPFLFYFKANYWVWIVVFFMAYCGLVYNEFFGLNFGLFSSCYTMFYQINGGKQLVAKKSNEDCVYVFGIDSVWKRAQNQMQYVNSLKMKLSVIFGVLQMLFGLSINILNKIKKKNWLVLMTLSIPQLIFLLCTFIYMNFLILYKWFYHYNQDYLYQAPSIISTMITVYTGFGQSPYLFWKTQRQLQKFLMVMAYLMIPIMLFGIPIGTYIKRKKKQIKKVDVDQDIAGAFNQLIDQKINNQCQSKTGSDERMSERKQNFSQLQSISLVYLDKQQNQYLQEPLQQIFVHSFIETIEYVLGTVSNTASYLRLWALSLAHGQLSQVIFNLILKNVISGGYIMIITTFICFIFFYLVTFGILICMDIMECFLHSLRLHWVEFQNKFYQGKGYKFQAFNFKLIYNK